MVPRDSGASIGARFGAVLVTMLGLVAVPLRAQLAVEIEVLPERLVIPLPHGSNRLLVADVVGPSREVWLAIARDATGRIPLERGQGSTWRINLASRAVAKLLLAAAADGDGSEFRIFASDEHGAIAQSVAIAYGVTARDGQAGELHLLDVGGVPVEVVPSWSRGPLWVEPAAIATITAFGTDAVIASARDLRTEFVARGDAKRSLTVDDELRAAWRSSGELRFEFIGGRARTVTIRAVPAAIALPADDPLVVTVKQRERVPVPGTNEWLRIATDDVTAGQTLVELDDADGNAVLTRRSLHDGEHATFTLGGRDYVLAVDKLVNFLIGDDFAIFTISTEAPKGPRVADLLRWIEDSPARFLRNGQEHAGVRAASHLRAKFVHSGAEVRSVDEFIERTASRSDASGEPYVVRMQDGTEQKLADWLRVRLREAAARK